MRSHSTVKIISMGVLLMALFGMLEPDPGEAFLEQFKDPSDGDFDLSYWLAEKKGCMTILCPRPTGSLQRLRGRKV